MVAITMTVVSWVVEVGTNGMLSERDLWENLVVGGHGSRWCFLLRLKRIQLPVMASW